MQVTFEIDYLPPQDGISLAQITTNVFYEKYMKVSYARKDLKHKYQDAFTHNQFFRDKVKELYVERISLQINIICSRRNKLEVSEIIKLENQKDQRIKMLKIVKKFPSSL